MPARTRSILIHFLGIFAFLSIPVFTSPDLGKNLFEIAGFKRNFFSFILLVALFYVNYYYFMPKFYFTKKTFLYVSFLIFSYALVSMVPDLLFSIDGHGMPPIPGAMGDPPPMHYNDFMFASDGGTFFKFMLVLSLSFVIKINTQLNEIHREKLKTEVSYLKAQINPHFLFNTLNSLYALTIEKSDDAPDAVLKLSNMMRYVVTESTKDFVPLEKEIDYIRDYIDLQRLRVIDEKNMEFTITGSPKGKSIAPLMAIPFIENAFKHGVNAEEDWKISISIDITGNVFTLDVHNRQVQMNLADTTEQGIDNTEKRLAFIYPGTHELVIRDTLEDYHIHLKINMI